MLTLSFAPLSKNDAPTFFQARVGLWSFFTHRVGGRALTGLG